MTINQSHTTVKKCNTPNKAKITNKHLVHKNVEASLLDIWLGRKPPARHFSAFISFKYSVYQDFDQTAKSASQAVI